MRAVLIIFALLAASVCEANGPTLSPGENFKDCDDCPEMVVLPAGTFLMGARKYDALKDMRFELNLRRISIERPFAVSKFEVTRAQFRLCVNAGGCKEMPPRKTRLKPEHPISWLSWAAAQEYVVWLSSVTMQKYSLLSEAEWEYAARGGTDKVFWWGDDLITGAEVCNQCLEISRILISLRQPKTVGIAKPNPFGLFDMLGNVSEWVQDCFYNSESYYSPEGEANEPSNCQYKVLKGGSYAGPSIRSLRISSRQKVPVVLRQPTYGLRLKRAIQ